MALFSDDEERKIYHVARKHLQAIDGNVTDGSPASLVWRKSDYLIVVVWTTRDVAPPEYDKDTRYYEQYNYHVALKVVYRNNSRFLRVMGSHEGGRNVWEGPFKCASCEYDLRKKG